MRIAPAFNALSNKYPQATFLEVDVHQCQVGAPKPPPVWGKGLPMGSAGRRAGSGELEGERFRQDALSGALAALGAITKSQNTEFSQTGRTKSLLEEIFLSARCAALPLSSVKAQ